MRKVLLADSVPEGLIMLKRTLVPMKVELEMVFVGSTSNGMVTFEKSSYEVFATDMIITGMDGLQLLKEAKTRYREWSGLRFLESR